MGAIMRPSLFLESVKILYFTDFARAFRRTLLRRALAKLGAWNRGVVISE